MKFAWVQNGIVRDVAHTTPSEIYHPDVAAFYNTEVPDGTISGATLVKGVWTNPLPPPPPDPAIAEAAYIQFKAKEVRTERNAKLASCDWTQLVDSPLENRDEWALYRQALRDVPSQSGFPTEIDWPVQPSVA